MWAGGCGCKATATTTRGTPGQGGDFRGDFITFYGKEKPATRELYRCSNEERYGFPIA